MPSKHRFSSMVGWIQFVFHHNFSGFDGQYFHVNILVSHIQCRVVHEGWKCFTVRSWELRWCHDLIGFLVHRFHSPIDTPRDIFKYLLLGIFVNLLLGIFIHCYLGSHDISLKYPVTSSRYRGSNFLRQRLVLSTVSGRPVVITDIRVKATAANLTRSNFTCFIPVKFAKYSHFLGDFSPASCLVLAGWRTWFEGLRGALGSPLLAIGGLFHPMELIWADYQAGFLWVCHGREALWPVFAEASFVRLLDKLCDGESLRAIFSEVNRMHTKKQYCLRIWHDMAANSVWLITLAPVFQNWYHEVQTSALTRQARRVPMSPSGASPSLKFFFPLFVAKSKHDEWFLLFVYYVDDSFQGFLLFLHIPIDSYYLK